MSEAAAGFASSMMADIIMKANEVIREKVHELRDWILYELNVYATECAWMKSRGEEPSELNAQDVENNIVIESHHTDSGIVEWTLRIRQEFQNLLDSGQESALWLLMRNARNRGGG